MIRVKLQPDFLTFSRINRFSITNIFHGKFHFKTFVLCGISQAGGGSLINLKLKSFLFFFFLENKIT